MKLLQKYPLPETWKAVYDPGLYVLNYFILKWSLDLIQIL